MEKTILQRLAEPIENVKWRVQSASEYGAICVPYIDARDAQERFDKVCGLNWKSEHFELGGKIYCKIGVLNEGEWIWRSDVGTETQVESEKGQASDAFKRAAVFFGVGRFLHEMNPIKAKAAKNQKGKWIAAYEDKGQIKPIYNAITLTRYCNTMNLRRLENA